MVRFIDDHRDVYGVELICALRPIAPSTYFRHKVQRADPTRRSARAQRNDALRVEIRRVWDANHQVYGPEGLEAAAARRTSGGALHGPPSDAGDGAGAVRGRAWMTPTHAVPDAGRFPDLVARDFTATRPNQLWVGDSATLPISA